MFQYDTPSPLTTESTRELAEPGYSAYNGQTSKQRFEATSALRDWIGASAWIHTSIRAGGAP